MLKTAVLLLPIGLAVAQHQMAPPPEKPVTLYHGMGTWHHPIATRNPEAQKYFDQGLALLYGFNRYESLRSFRKASELDPQAAMAFWGMAMAQAAYINMDGDPSYDLKGSCADVDAGLKIAGAPARERAYLQAAATRCPEEKSQAYIGAMRALAERYPDDLDASTLYAESLMIPVRWGWYAADGTPAAGVSEAERVLEQVLRRWPDHPGANHYYIHAVESSKTPERGIPSAMRLMGIVPEAGHVVHMPGHIWLAIGDYETAASVNERASEVDRQYFETTNVTTSSYGMYYAHNLHFIYYARSMQGRKAETLAAAKNLAAVVAPLVEAMPEMVDAFAAVPLFGAVRFNAWNAVLAVPKPSDKLPITNAVWHYTRALAMAGKGDGAGAAKEQAAFEALRAKLPPDGMWSVNKAGPVFAMASEIVAARVASSVAEALPHWTRAVSMQDGLTYDEPPAWYYPVRESLGAALMRAGKPGEAEAVFRDGLRRTPRNGRLLFGLLESLKAQNKADAVEWVRKEFEAAWGKADVRLKLEEM